jgi:hypothetical protein
VGGPHSHGSALALDRLPLARLFTGATRRAVEVRDRECCDELCDVPAEHCQIDHVRPYAEGGLSTGANGRPACAFHNRARERRRT